MLQACVAQLTNQIRVLLQRVKMAGREPHKILMHQGLKEVLLNEIRDTANAVPLARVRVFEKGATIYDKRVGAEELTFEEIPIVVDNSVGEILIQVKPREYAEKDIVSKVPWKKIMKMRRL